MRSNLRTFFGGFITILTVSSFAIVPLASAAAGSETCLYTGGGTDTKWSTVANWSGCSGAAPVSGDSVSFDASSSTGDLTMHNDISGLTLNAMTNTNSHFVIIDGSDFSLSGGASSTGGQRLLIKNNVTLTADQTLHNTQVQGQLAIGNYTLTAESTSAAESTIIQKPAGAGNIVLNGGSILGLHTADFTGNVTANQGSVTLNTNGSPAAVTIKSGSSLFVAQTSAQDTLSNNLTIEGNGDSDSAALVSSYSDSNGDPDTADTTLTFTGNVTLTGNATVAGNNFFTGATARTHKSTFIFAGNYVANGFSFNPLANSNTTVQIGNVATTNAKAPKTGLAVVATSPLQTLAITAFAGTSLFFIGRRVLAKSAVRR